MCLGGGQPEAPINAATYSLSQSDTAVTKEVVADPFKAMSDKVGVPTTVKATSGMVDPGLNLRM
jgi:hypothetical protein